ncbi:hypothetical protein [Hymenobacter rubripertinctus]|uniref:Uncharacterized protein n=1 Tax=Hymenobacter rubripertinctus TaxID=2029981 RepID=A0A418R2D2_9BACT|nr:hypothetical protein [Hymenobacter rubripertinctus]RIY11582.1 hypothetical protein D0T11_07170 [Hymenobacter rubripertinctus]
MFKKLLLLILAFTMLLVPEDALATHSGRPAATSVGAEALTTASLFRRSAKRGRPNYAAYRGNSRHKLKKLGPVRRWKLYLKAKKRRSNRVPSVKVGAPVRSTKK